MKRNFHHTSHLGKMNIDKHLPVSPSHSTPAQEAATLRKEIKTAESWVLYFSGATAQKRYSKEACKENIAAHEKTIANLKSKLAALEPKKVIAVDVDLAVKALGEVANMTKETETRLNELILSGAPAEELIKAMEER